MIDRWKNLATDLAEFEAYCNEKGNRNYHAINALDSFHQRKQREQEKIEANDKMRHVET